MSDSRASSLSNCEIRLEGWKALTERLGVSGAIHFLTQYDPGRGYYTEERHRLLAGLTLERRDRRRPEGCSNKTDKESSHCRPHLGSL